MSGNIYTHREAGMGMMGDRVALTRAHRDMTCAASGNSSMMKDEIVANKRSHNL